MFFKRFTVHFFSIFETMNRKNLFLHSFQVSSPHFNYFVSPCHDTKLSRAWILDTAENFPDGIFFCFCFHFHREKINLKLHFTSTGSAFSWKFIVLKTLYIFFAMSERLNPFLTHIHYEHEQKNLKHRQRKRQKTVSCVYCLIIIVLYG